MVESVDKDLKVRTPMALDHRDIFEPASLEEGNPIFPYEEFDSRKLLGLAAFIILHIRPDSTHCAAILARFIGCPSGKLTNKLVARYGPWGPRLGSIPFKGSTPPRCGYLQCSFTALPE